METKKRIANSLYLNSDECVAKNNLLDCNLYFDEFNLSNHKSNKSEKKSYFNNDGLCIWSDQDNKEIIDIMNKTSRVKQQNSNTHNNQQYRQKQKNFQSDNKNLLLPTNIHDDLQFYRKNQYPSKTLFNNIKNYKLEFNPIQTSRQNNLNLSLDFQASSRTPNMLLDIPDAEFSLPHNNIENQSFSKRQKYQFDNKQKILNQYDETFRKNTNYSEQTQQIVDLEKFKKKVQNQDMEEDLNFSRDNIRQKSKMKQRLKQHVLQQKMQTKNRILFATITKQNPTIENNKQLQKNLQFQVQKIGYQEYTDDQFLQKTNEIQYSKALKDKTEIFNDIEKIKYIDSNQYIIDPHKQFRIESQEKILPLQQFSYRYRETSHKKQKQKNEENLHLEKLPENKKTLDSFEIFISRKQQIQVLKNTNLNVTLGPKRTFNINDLSVDKLKTFDSKIPTNFVNDKEYEVNLKKQTLQKYLHSEIYQNFEGFVKKSRIL